jgi:cyanate permease
MLLHGGRKALAFPVHEEVLSWKQQLLMWSLHSVFLLLLFWFGLVWFFFLFVCLFCIVFM